MPAGRKYFIVLKHRPSTTWAPESRPIWVMQPGSDQWQRRRQRAKQRPAAHLVGKVYNLHSATTSNSTRQSAAIASANWQLQLALAASVISVCYRIRTVTDCDLPRSRYDSGHETTTVNIPTQSSIHTCQTLTFTDNIYKISEGQMLQQFWNYISLPLFLINHAGKEVISLKCYVVAELLKHSVFFFFTFFSLFYIFPFFRGSIHLPRMLCISKNLVEWRLLRR